MNQEMLAAVQEGRIWLDQFQRLMYRKVFASYKERFGPVFVEAVAACPDDAALQALAVSYLDALEAGWKKYFFWERGGIRVDEKQVIVNYLSPMLLALEDPRCVTFAECLRDEWNRRRPKDPYRIATYEKITKGFRNAILGIDLNNRHMEEGRDED